MFFLIKILLIQPLKSEKIFLPNLKKCSYPKTSQTLRSVVTNVLYHFCDMSLITACAIFCSLKFHVVCTCILLETLFAS